MEKRLKNKSVSQITSQHHKLCAHCVVIRYLFLCLHMLSVFPLAIYCINLNVRLVPPLFNMGWGVWPFY